MRSVRRSFALRPAALAAGLLALAACGEQSREIQLDSFDAEASSRTGIRSASVPDALMVRFRQMQGEGFSRKGWEIEILQMGEEVRIRGSVRDGTLSVPVYRPMSGGDFAEFWDWLRRHPLDGHQVAIDESAPEADWKKSLEVDVVLGSSQRWISRNTWTRPLAAGDWAGHVEDRLHVLILDLAEREITRIGIDSAGSPSGRDEAVREALEALGEGAEANLPGGVGDLE